MIGVDVVVTRQMEVVVVRRMLQGVEVVDPSRLQMVIVNHQVLVQVLARRSRWPQVEGLERGIILQE